MLERKEPNTGINDTNESLGYLLAEIKDRRQYLLAKQREIKQEFLSLDKEESEASLKLTQMYYESKNKKS